MKKFISIVFILTLTLFVVPSQTYAAWWNPVSWFSKNQQVEEQKQQQNDTLSNTAPELPTANQNSKEVEKPSTVAPSDNIQSSDAKTIDDLKTEVATLKTNLDNLYKAHNNLVNDHNALLKYVNATILSGKNAGTATSNSNLEAMITSLENKLNDVCAQIFSSFGVLSANRCPSPRFIIGGWGTLEDRIRKLEGGY